MIYYKITTKLVRRLFLRTNLNSSNPDGIKNKDENIHKYKKSFVALPTDRWTKYLQNRRSFMRESAQKNASDISIRGRENHVSP